MTQEYSLNSPAIPAAQTDVPDLLSAMLSALRGRDAGQSLQSLWPAWRDATGMSRSSLNVLLHGRYKSNTAKAAYKTVAEEAARRGRATDHPRLAPRMGREPRLTCEVILQIRASAAQGMEIKAIARQYKTTPKIAHHIVGGSYYTAAMKRALELESSSPPPSIPL